MVLINFSHPLTAEQVAQVTGLLGEEPEVRTVAVQVDQEAGLAEQVRVLVDGVGLSAEEWQTLPVVVHVPGLAPVAAVLLAELHGRMGLFPAMVRLRPVAGSTPTRFEVAEVINLQQVREHSRGLR